MNVPRRSQLLPFALPDLGEREFQRVREALESGWITTGPATRAFEEAFAAAVGAKYAVAVNSCTAAMHLALEAIGLKRGDEVITTPYTFAATAEVIRYFDARPVLVDIDARTLNLRPDLLEGAITTRTRAIVPVHVAGLPADMDPILDAARRHRLYVIEDAAHAFPAGYRGRMVGQLGHFTCFSFYATKTITTGEGGMITTDNEAWARRCRLMALHGIDRDPWKRGNEATSWYYEITAPGFKYNMTDIAAAMGHAQLERAEEMCQRREQIARRYQQAFAELPMLQTPTEPEDGRHAWHLYTLRLHTDRLLIDRDRFAAELRRRNIGISVHFIPLHLHPYYRSTFGYQAEDFPEANAQYRREISLPLYSKMSDADVDDVIMAVEDVARRFQRPCQSERLQVA